MTAHANIPDAADPGQARAAPAGAAVVTAADTVSADTGGRPGAQAPASRSARWRELVPDVAAFMGALVCAVLAAVLAGTLGGCGGGVGTEGTGGFASGTSSASGPIVGFGSIVVNGIHFDEANAAVEDDDAKPQKPSVLALGMMVQVTGGAVTTDALSGRQTATATQVRYNRALVGPVAARDALAGTLRILGQTVVVSADTVFDSSLAGGLSSAGTAVGAMLEVYGSFDASTATLLATRIAPASAAAYCVRGTVTAVSTDSSGAKSFVINGQTYSAAGLADTSTLAVGAVLKVELQDKTDAKGRWVAGSQSPGQLSGSTSDRDGVKLQGLVASISSASRLVVEGVAVDISSAKLSGTLKLGAQVEVSGALRSGVLVATELKITSSGSPRSYELEGTPLSIDVVNKRLVLRGTSVSFARSDLVFKSGTLAQLVAGYSGSLHIVGVLSADRTVVEATSIEFDN